MIPNHVIWHKQVDYGLWVSPIIPALVFTDPLKKVTDPGIDPGVAGVGASISPGNYSSQGVVVTGVPATVRGMN